LQRKRDRLLSLVKTGEQLRAIQKEAEKKGTRGTISSCILQAGEPADVTQAMLVLCKHGLSQPLDQQQIFAVLKGVWGGGM
jgi:hypothetical protein